MSKCGGRIYTIIFDAHVVQIRFLSGDYLSACGNKSPLRKVTLNVQILILDYFVNLHCVRGMKINSIKYQVLRNQLNSLCFIPYHKTCHDIIFITIIYFLLKSFAKIYHIFYWIIMTNWFRFINNIYKIEKIYL